MGVEFLQKVGKSIKVALDGDLEALARGDLFSRNLLRPKRFELLRITTELPVQSSDDVQLEQSGTKIVAVVGNRIIGEIEAPSPELRAMIEAYGIVSGRVEDVFEGARVADIEIIE